MHSLEFRELKWGSADGRRIPIKELDAGHLVNILNWVYDRPKSYPPSIYVALVQEALYRKFIEFAMGEPWPERDGEMWVLIHPATGEGFIKPPPQEYLDTLAALNIDLATL
jgi:hypothetical protein